MDMDNSVVIVREGEGGGGWRYGGINGDGKINKQKIKKSMSNKNSLFFYISNMQFTITRTHQACTITYISTEHFEYNFSVNRNVWNQREISWDTLYKYVCTQVHKCTHTKTWPEFCPNVTQNCLGECLKTELNLVWIALEWPEGEQNCKVKIPLSFVKSGNQQNIEEDKGRRWRIWLL